MGNKIKIHEIAKELGISSKEALERAKKLGIDVASHLSGVEDDEAKRIKESFKNSGAKKEEKPKKQPEAKAKKEQKKY